MDDSAARDLLERSYEVLLCDPGPTVFVGDPDVCRQLVDALGQVAERAEGVVAWTPVEGFEPGGAARLEAAAPGAVVVVEDRHKEGLLRALAALDVGLPRVVLGGTAHLDFDEPAYHEALGRLRERSLAHGYPLSRVHLFQCLQQVVRRGLEGTIVEFGTFRGGTTQFLREADRLLGGDHPIIGFDTFDGLPPRRHLLDLYEHAALAELDLDEVRGRLEGEGIEVVPGDLVDTVGRLEGVPVVLAFVDTDTYTGARAAIGAVAENVVVGGAIVLDHYPSIDAGSSTLGERMAARELLGGDGRWFNPHGTGMFLRQA